MTTALLHELDCLCEAIDEAIGGPNTKEARRMEARHAKRLAAYFRRLRDSFPYEKLDNYVISHGVVKEVSAEELAADILIVDWVAEHTGVLGGILAANATESYTLGGTQALDEVSRLRLFVGPAPVESEYVNLLRRTAAGRVKDMSTMVPRASLDRVTRDRLRGIIVKGAQDGQGAAKIARTIRLELGDMANAYKGRSMTIARTELNNHLSAAALDGYKKLGVNAKGWALASSSPGCPTGVCPENADAGLIPVGDLFPSGHDAPVGHPNCLCSLYPGVL